MTLPRLLIPLIFVLDQWTKHAVLQHFESGGTAIEVTSFFKIVLAYNRGVSFSLFHTSNETGFWILTAVIFLIAAGVFVWLVREKNSFNKILLALIVGGALGNLYDRITIRAVVDFLYFFWHNYGWPAFNVADSAICVGTLLMAIRSFKPDNK